MLKRKRAIDEGREVEEDEPIGGEALRQALASRTKSSVKYINKQRVLLLCSRGITVRQRHLSTQR